MEHGEDADTGARLVLTQQEAGVSPGDLSHGWPGRLLYPLFTAGLATSFTHWSLLAWPPPLLTGHGWYAEFPLVTRFTLLLFSFYSNLNLSFDEERKRIFSSLLEERVQD